MSFKVGDRVKCLQEYRSMDDINTSSLVYGSTHTVVEVSANTGNLNLGVKDTWWNASRFELVVEVPVNSLSAAFNMWKDDYMNNPQAYEASHDSAIRHLKEKLNGEEPSYGAVCAEVLIKYLEKV